MSAKPTGVFLTEEEYEEVVSLVESRIKVDLRRKINEYTTDGSRARIRLQELAVAHGLPRPDPGQTYGLSTEREIMGW